MKEKIFNSTNLNSFTISKSVFRVKCFIVNSENKILVAFSNGKVQFPGGHVEPGEKLVETVKRELQEETGIVVEQSEISEPFFKIVHYSFDRVDASKVKSSTLYYFVVNTDKRPDANNLNLTENEKELEFNVKFMTIDELDRYIDDQIRENDGVYSVIATEMKEAFDEFKNIRSE